MGESERSPRRPARADSDSSRKADRTVKRNQTRASDNKKGGTRGPDRARSRRAPGKSSPAPKETDAVESQEPELIERLINVNRVAKVVKGGRRFGFNALVAVGDANGTIGVGLGKAVELPEAIRKATESAKKQMIRIPLVEGRTIPHTIVGRHGAGKVLLRPASSGTGLIAGSAVRAILECAGVKDVLSKSQGSKNYHNVVRATMAGLRDLVLIDEISSIRRREVERRRADA